MSTSDYARRVLPDGRILTAFPLTFGRGRLCISKPGDDLGYYDAW